MEKEKKEIILKELKNHWCLHPENVTDLQLEVAEFVINLKKTFEKEIRKFKKKDWELIDLEYLYKKYHKKLLNFLDEKEYNADKGLIGDDTTSMQKSLAFIILRFYDIMLYEFCELLSIRNETRYKYQFLNITFAYSKTLEEYFEWSSYKLVENIGDFYENNIANKLDDEILIKKLSDICLDRLNMSNRILDEYGKKLMTIYTYFYFNCRVEEKFCKDNKIIISMVNSYIKKYLNKFNQNTKYREDYKILNAYIRIIPFMNCKDIDFDDIRFIYETLEMISKVDNSAYREGALKVISQLYSKLKKGYKEFNKLERLHNDTIQNIKNYMLEEFEKNCNFSKDNVE